MGRFTYDPASPAATTASLFDIASLSKVVATTAMAMILYERGLLDLEAPVTAIVPEFAASDARRREVTLRMLLAHNSGLPAYEKLFLRAKTREELLHAAFATDLSPRPVRAPNTATSASSFSESSSNAWPMSRSTRSASAKSLVRSA
jgi:serine-type D-Ala-D-Ala carboxypeptidase